MISGYVTIVIPFVVAIADRTFGKPFYPKGGYSFRTHMEEGGSIEDFHSGNCRRNPFDINGVEDPFYQQASWLSPNVSLGA